MNQIFLRQDVIKALQVIDNKPELLKKRLSTTYVLHYNGRSYPPILAISLANELRGGKELKLSDFGNNIDKPFTILRDLGFEIKTKDGIKKNSNEQAFKKWLTVHSPTTSNLVSSYVTALKWLSSKYKAHGQISASSIFEIKDPEKIDVLYKEALKIQKNEESYIYNKQARSYGDSGFYSASLSKYKQFLIQILDESNSNFQDHIVDLDFDLHSFRVSLQLSGLAYHIFLITRFSASLLTKPFVILTGLSGSGKTKLAQAFVQWICQDDNQYRIIPVGADWTNREPLLGYPNALKPEVYVKPDSGVLDLIIQANDQPDLPHFLILDEMNLSHVERYFADFLSVMESKEEIPLHAEKMVQNGVPEKLKVPSNLFIIGTVNIDETTNMFSPKVLDRANTIEFRVTQDEMKNFLGNIRDINTDVLTGKGAGMAKSFLEMAASREFATADIAEINAALVQFFGELKKTGAEFGYRTATEILRLIHQLTVLDNELTTSQKIDIAIMQKLLPKLHGSRRKLCPVLETLGSFCITDKVSIIKDVFDKADFDYNGDGILYPLSLEKIARMYRGAIDNGFASFAEA